MFALMVVFYINIEPFCDFAFTILNNVVAINCIRI